MATPSAADLKEERRKAFEDVSRALEAISVKSLMEFRGRMEVPRPVQSVAVASVCMVARIDDSMEVGSDGLPPRTWEAAQASMAKPGHFVNALRQFPYAVDSGRMPDVNVFAARQCLEDVSPEHLNDEPVAERLLEWIQAACRYCEVVQILRLQTSVSAPQVSEPAPVVDRALAASNDAIQGTPPPSPGQALGRPAVPESGETPGKAMRSSIGSQVSSVGGTNSVFGRSPIPDPSPGSIRSSRPSGGPGQAIGGDRVPRGSRGQRSSNASSGYGARRTQDTTTSTFRVTPSASPSSIAAGRTPPSTRASPSAPSTMPQKQPKVSTGGYPRNPAPRSNVGIEDWQQKIEQMQREAREMKAMEGKLKWGMKREEEKQVKCLQAQDNLKTIKWRQQETKNFGEEAETREVMKKNERLNDAKKFQDFKRDAKQREIKRNEARASAEYLEDKEYSERVVEDKRSLPLEAKRMIIDSNMERLADLANYNLMEAQQQKYQQQLSRELLEEQDLSLQMLAARKERDAALQSLEFFRNQQRLALPDGRDIPTRPFSPSNKPL